MRTAITTLLVASALAVPAAAVAAPKHAHSAPNHAHSAPRHAHGQAALASRLARGIVRARSAPARVKALRAGLKALHIGVYTARGKAIQRGAERGVRDLYVYDFELRAIADALARGQTYGLADESSLLSAISGTKIGAGQLATLLHAGIRDALAHPSDPSAVLPLLIRDLGRDRKPAFDPARAFTADRVRLDPVQYFLLNASFLGEPLRRDNAHGRTHATVDAGSGGGNAHAAGGPCPVVEPDPNSRPQLGDSVLGWWVKREAKKLSTKIAKAFDVKSLVDKILAGLHGSVLAYSLRVQALDTALSTHYGPADAGLSADAGNPIKFRAEVVMLDDLGDQTINCLALAGIKLPHKGPVPGVPIRWQYAEGNLLQHGSVNPAGGLLGPKSTTDATGVAELTFTPKDELIPGLGVDSHDTGVVDGIALWQDAFGNGASLYGIKWNEYVTPIFSGIRWDVGYHNQLATLEVTSSQSYTDSGTGPAPLDEQYSDNEQFTLQGSVPISSDAGGAGSLTWTAFQYHFQSYFPHNSGQCYGPSEPGSTDSDDGQNPQPGAVAVRQITGLPSVSVTIAVTPGTYNIHSVGVADSGSCGNYTSDQQSSWDGGFAGHSGITSLADNVYKITGWTPGAPGSGVFATKTITDANHTITLKIVPRFG